jgi:hypothetical protein
MKVIKGNNIYTLVGELYNIRMGRLEYIDGVRIGSPIEGYPTVTDGPIKHVIKAKSCTIYLPMRVFVPQFINAVKSVMNIFGILNVLDHEIIQSTANCVVKKASQVDNFSGYNNNGFSWLFLDQIRLIDKNINMCAVYFDIEDWCNVAHNDVINGQFKLNYIRNIRSDVVPRVRLLMDFAGTDHIISHEIYGRCPKSFNRIDRSVVQADLNDILAISGGTAASMSICAECHHELYGDNYILTMYNKDPYSTAAIPMCALCLHSKPTYLEYLCIFRVTYPITAKDILMRRLHTKPKIEYTMTSYKQSTAPLDLLLECLKGVVRDGDYYLIGDKYIGVSSIQALLNDKKIVDLMADRDLVLLA